MQREYDGSGDDESRHERKPAVSSDDAGFDVAIGGSRRGPDDLNPCLQVSEQTSCLIHRKTS